MKICIWWVYMGGWC